MDIDLNNPITWDIVKEVEEVHMQDVIDKVDNIGKLIDIEDIDNIEEVWNCLEYVEATLEYRVPFYV